MELTVWTRLEDQFDIKEIGTCKGLLENENTHDVRDMRNERGGPPDFFLVTNAVADIRIST